jgi:putative ABC transport system substrate-binding protein
MTHSPMQRREFITLGGGAAAAWPFQAYAQQRERMRRVGVLMTEPENDPESRVRAAVFQQTLERLGWVVGRNLAIDYRWPAGDLARTRAAVAELLPLAPDVIVAAATPGALASRSATQTIPVVFVGVSEPVAQGFVQSLARPGGNLTGFSMLEPTIGGKWLELLKELAPGVKRVMVMFNPQMAPNGPLFFRSVLEAGQKLAVETVTAIVNDVAEVESAVTELARVPGGGLIVIPDTFTATNRKLLIDLATRYRVPAAYAFRFFATDGGLMSYGVDIKEQFRQAAGYVDRILRGEKPADLPVQQPVKFELVINMKTAKTLGLTVPLTLQVAADEVIE